jgi:hypothetical protein
MTGKHDFYVEKEFTWVNVHYSSLNLLLPRRILANGYKVLYK